MALAPMLAGAAEEAMANDEETAAVAEALSAIGCEAVEVEKESDALFEIDDGVCEIGQYDMKLDGDGKLLSMTYDGPVDD